ncbi:MAG: methyltransferase domain-containing protein [Acidobacteria bacterium]|nr:methyltransferase domain-containing protein [Acidobacteriota bacterium]
MGDTQTMESTVRQRYAAAAQDREEALCCPVSYGPEYLAVLPQEILEKDYGCGDPSRYIRAGETVLDLGSGTGKVCYIASQIVGPQGCVIGVDMNDAMLAVARKYQQQIAGAIGYDNVRFHKARIQDLKLDRERLDRWLRDHPVASESDLIKLESFQQELRSSRPLVPDESVDIVVSNCVLNLVDSDQKGQLFGEIYRVLRNGGRAAISDIVCDEDVSEDMLADPELWSGCISGALREDRFLRGFEEAGFYGVRLDRWSRKPWRTLRGIEFRSVTVLAYKGKEGECWDYKDAVIYRGPFREVLDDDGHRYRRGDRVAVCRKTALILQREPYREHFEGVPPRVEVAPGQARPFRCTAGASIRSPRETKGEDYAQTEADGSACCEPGQCC